jgi:hypothetical protein
MKMHLTLIWIVNNLSKSDNFHLVVSSVAIMYALALMLKSISIRGCLASI